MTQLSCQVVGRRDLCSTVRELRLRRRDGQPFAFEPGHYVVLHLRNDEGDESRPYSICQPPDDSGELSVCIQHTDSSFAARLAAADDGVELTADPPAGCFTLPEQLEGDLLLIATGTGVAPFRAMAERLRADTTGLVWLLFGARFVEGLLYDADWRQLAAERDGGFHYLPTLSRPTDGWAGSTGRVQNVLPSLLATLPRPGQTTAYLCGFPEMLAEARPLLVGAGLSAAQIIDRQY